MLCREVLVCNGGRIFHRFGGLGIIVKIHGHAAGNIIIGDHRVGQGQMLRGQFGRTAHLLLRLLIIAGLISQIGRRIIRKRGRRAFFPVTSDCFHHRPIRIFPGTVDFLQVGGYQTAIGQKLVKKVPAAFRRDILDQRFRLLYLCPAFRIFTGIEIGDRHLGMGPCGEKVIGGRISSHLLLKCQPCISLDIPLFKPITEQHLLQLRVQSSRSRLHCVIVSLRGSGRDPSRC